MTDAKLKYPKMSEARLRMLSSPGHLYAAYSRGQCWIKLGFSLNVERRLQQINHRFPALAPFTLIGTTPSVYAAERQMHRVLASFRHHSIGLSRELYLAMPAVERLVSVVVAGVDRPRMTLDEVLSAMRWARDQSRDLREPVRQLYREAHRSGYVEVLE